MAAYEFAQDFANLNSALGQLGKQNEAAWLRNAQADVGQSLGSGDYLGAAQKAFRYGDHTTGLGLLKLGEQAKDRAADASLVQGLFGGGGAALAPLGQKTADIGTPNDVENTFVSTVKGAGLTNPVGLGAVAAYGKAESGYNPGNVNRSWSDPSQSGQPGTAGGIMSWRADRLQNLQRFAAERGEQGNGSPQTQALFLAQEDPTLLPKLQAAKTPQEANQIMADAWRFAGYNQQGGENARRLALTQGYGQRFAGQGGAVPAVPVQVAQNEADVQRLEAQQGNPVVDQQQPVQVAQVEPNGASASDAPAQGAAETQFVIPGTGITVDQQTLSSNPRIQNMVRALAVARGEKAQAAIKQALDLEIADAKMRMDTGGPLDRQGKALQNEKLRRELDGKGFRNLTADERAAAGVPDDYKGVVQIDRDGQIHFPGKPATEVNIDQKAQSASEVGRAQSNVKFLSGIADSGPTLAQRSADMDMLATVLRDAPQGSGADLRVYLDRVGKTLGMSDGQLATRADAINAIVQRIAPTLHVAGSGSTSDIEFKGMINSLPSLSNTPEGSRLILSTIARQNEITRMRVEVANAWAAGDLKDGEARRKIAQIDRQSIFASPEEKALVRKLASTAKGGELGATSAPLERNVNGQTYTMRDGQWYLKEGFH